MNANVEFQKNCRKKFGVTFSKNMSISSMVETWDNASDEVRQANPTLNTLFTTISASAITFQAAYTAFLILKAALKTTESSAMTAIPGVGAGVGSAQISTKVQEEVQKILADQLQGLGENILNSM